MSSDGPAEAATHRFTALAMLGVVIAAMGVFAAFSVPRLTNYGVGDIEFTGWSGPLGRELAAGRRPYSDFVVPIPPGSMALLAAVHRVAGEPRLIHELGLIAVCHILLAVLGYAIVRPLTTRENAVMVAAASGVVLTRGLKECAYDQTAAVLAWASVALCSWALVEQRGRQRTALWALAGGVGAFTLFFKQSTAIGVLGGSLVLGAYLALTGAVDAKRLRRDAAASLGGVGLGLALVALCVRAVGSDLGAFLQAVIFDGPALKGGSRAVGANLGHYLLGAPVFPASVLLTVGAAVVLVRLARRPTGLALADASPAAPLGWQRAALVGAGTVGAFGVAALLVASDTRALPESLSYFTDRMRLLPGFGLLFACVGGVAHFLAPRATEPEDRERWARGHRLNAVLLLALVVGLSHNLSSPEFRPFYDPNPTIPLAFAFLFLALDQAALPRAKLGVFALALCAVLSPRLDRALAARVPIGPEGDWGGLFVSESALPIVRAALRARELTTADDTVLVLPEDLQIAALIGRPRPPLTGRVVFVDQYAPRLLAGDLERLETTLPKLVVLRPAERDLWAIVFAHWNSNSAAGRVVDRFLVDWLPRRYRRDSSFVTRYGDKQGTLELWVRTDR
jgi:hypothetical protein